MERSDPSDGDPARRRRALPAGDPFEALADVESQAAAWSRDERAAEVDDRALEAYRSVTLAGRLVATLGRQVVVDVVGDDRVRGRLAGAGDGWMVLDTGEAGGAVLVLTAAVTAVSGVAGAAASAAAWPLASRRSVGAVLHRFAEDAGAVLVATGDARRRRGRAVRVGADFVEVVDETGQALLVPLAAITTVRGA